MFTIEQAEKIAETIFHYEHDRFTPPPYAASAACLALTASRVLITGEAHDDLAWSLNIKLGAHPADLEKSDYTNQHPLYFVAAFEDCPEVRDPFLKRLKNNIDGVKAEPSYYGSAIAISAQPLPGPKDLSLRLSKVHSHYFHPLHAAWYTPKVLSRLAASTLTYQTGMAPWLSQVARALSGGGQGTATLQEIATKVILRELATKPSLNTDYEAIAQIINVGDGEQIEAALSSLSNIYTVLCVTLPNPSPETMARGLKALAGSKHHNMLRYMRRSPTIEELSRGNVKGAAAVWRLMPWKHLEPVVREHGTQLRAQLLKRAEVSYEELKQCLVDHDKRLTDLSSLNPLAEEEANERVHGPHRNVGAWSQFQHGVQRYFSAIRLREVLAESYSPLMARMIAFRHLAQRDDLARYTDPLLTEAARAALASYDLPIRPSSRRKPNGEPKSHYETP